MKYGVYLYPPAGGGDPKDVMRLAHGAERLQFDSVWLGDHIAWPARFDPSTHRDVGGKTPGPAVVNLDVLEPLTMLSFLAAAVQRVRLGVGVLIAPYRNPILSAKMLAMLDVLSGGRLIVGVGTGWLREEFAMLDAPPYENRGSVTDEYLRSFVQLWTEAEPHFEGTYARVSDVFINPKPIQKPHPPLWIGGNGSAALRRAARYGDGWMPLHQAPAEMADKVRRLREMAQSNERRSPSMGVAIGCRFRFSDRSDGDDTLTGTITQVIDQLRRYQEAGVEEVHLLNDGYASVPDLLDGWDRFASEVIAKV
jgi:probable F420-dependent oxidoreductase